MEASEIEKQLKRIADSLEKLANIAATKDQRSRMIIQKNVLGGQR